MSLYSRLQRGSDMHPKISTWGFITTFTRVMDGRMDFAEFATEHQLEPAEQTEAQEYLAAITARITENVQRRMAEGAAQQTATEDARSYWFTKVWQCLAQIEFGYITESEVRATFGLE